MFSHVFSRVCSLYLVFVLSFNGFVEWNQMVASSWDGWVSSASITFRRRLLPWLWQNNRRKMPFWRLSQLYPDRSQIFEHWGPQGCASGKVLKASDNISRYISIQRIAETFLEALDGPAQQGPSRVVVFGVVGVASWVCRSEGRADLAELRWRWPKGGNSHERISKEKQIKNAQQTQESSKPSKDWKLRCLEMQATRTDHWRTLACRIRGWSHSRRRPWHFSCVGWTCRWHLIWAPKMAEKESSTIFSQNTPLRRTSLETDMHCGSFSKCLSCL